MWEDLGVSLDCMVDVYIKMLWVKLCVVVLVLGVVESNGGVELDLI